MPFNEQFGFEVLIADTPIPEYEKDGKHYIECNLYTPVSYNHSVEETVNGETETQTWPVTPYVIKLISQPESEGVYYYRVFVDGVKVKGASLKPGESRVVKGFRDGTSVRELLFSLPRFATDVEDRLVEERLTRVGLIEVECWCASLQASEWKVRKKDLVFTQANKKDSYSVTGGQFTMATSKAGRVINPNSEFRCIDHWRRTTLKSSLSVAYRVGAELSEMGFQVKPILFETEKCVNNTSLKRKPENDGDDKEENGKKRSRTSMSRSGTQGEGSSVNNETTTVKAEMDEEGWPLMSTRNKSSQNNSQSSAITIDLTSDDEDDVCFVEMEESGRDNGESADITDLTGDECSAQPAPEPLNGDGAEERSSNMSPVPEQASATISSIVEGRSSNKSPAPEQASTVAEERASNKSPVPEQASTVAEERSSNRSPVPEQASTVAEERSSNTTHVPEEAATNVAEERSTNKSPDIEEATSESEVVSNSKSQNIDDKLDNITPNTEPDLNTVSITSETNISDSGIVQEASGVEDTVVAQRETNLSENKNSEVEAATVDQSSLSEKDSGLCSTLETMTSAAAESDNVPADDSNLSNVTEALEKSDQTVEHASDNTTSLEPSKEPQPARVVSGQTVEHASDNTTSLEPSKEPQPARVVDSSTDKPTTESDCPRESDSAVIDTSDTAGTGEPDRVGSVEASTAQTEQASTAGLVESTSTSTDAPEHFTDNIAESISTPDI